MTIWNPQQYLKFGDYRLRPALDLIARIPLATAQVVVDLGCGAGTVSPHLQNRWQMARVIGVDSSADMLAHARQQYPQIEWVQSDIASWQPSESCDILFSNAVLHWLVHHDVLLPRLLQCVKPSGIFAIQLPMSFDTPSHTLITQTALQGVWAETLRPLLRESPVQSPEYYYDLLAPHVQALDMWESVYWHVLTGENPVVEWMKGTWLKPLLDVLNPEEQRAFEQAYRAVIAQAYPRRADGSTLFPFRRLFLIAQC
ncbi:trans-aconitate methyltransferase [Beggiatoa alba B18LD]|uniref:Trans-aconitate methyltransferase n=1 Tax=Beggiatoa alba B18LD TaxID=395493 RepID=I3CEF3_9GAMM|nr:methyltransferase domain-containing protein [Beggiatoa alba]EIJ41996.1 trans-aconitate methyltransferase [Beggiatoa alba B18LD]